MTNESLLTASLVLDHLVAGGAREFFFAPGSRSAPFAYTAAGRDGTDLRAHVRLDERSAAFHALGAARATGTPSAVITTSGTAVGNLLPAVLEADHAEVPLVLLTADRPPELRGTGANQTTRQPGVFGDHVRAAVDVVVPRGLTGAALGADVAEALAPALSALRGDDGVPPGPVHINVALREPLQPALDDLPVSSAGAGRTDTGRADTGRADTGRTGTDGNGAAGSAAGPGWVPSPLDPVHAVDLGPGEAAELAAAAGCLPQHRTVILAGDGAGPAAAEMATALGLPLLAEPSSGARGGETAVGPYRLLLDSATGRSIERVLLIGRPTLSRPVGRLLARTDLRTAAWQPAPVAWYEDGRRQETVLRSLGEVLDFTGRGAPEWLAAWRGLGAQAQRGVDDELDHLIRTAPGFLPGPAVAREVWRACGRDGAALVAGSSNPIRDLDLSAEPGSEGAGNVRVIANRGLAGIDGTVATAAGVSLATEACVRVLLGDLTFLHDAGSLLHLKGEGIPDAQLVVLDDRGGGIFATLEHGELAEEPRWAGTVERFFGTEPEADIAGLCRAYGVPVVEVADLPGLREALSRPIRGTSVVVVAARREGLRDLHARITRRVDALGTGSAG
ncbi:2-succinyl-5-enolpyruvyl-6-hydroxy-3-cyclohexene-1-carboxylic-acid synthase [Kocuria coralli]|uniref:2-succinyl-5-enolpyruvyl-6-hydroxy-3-cyclohexene-1-carboxylate synthase n=1 Tax=Kocuria coralli TaxID=1461025 RepID=A0A5J5L244_9MICC|nr:2-succinyl-5-enolpyruvyl-6-hydroxy-3-cyclohexene-1-carboxylic-acid synthase [Kocuria coralli]KAA9395275.1 2-succinyl-5-enolpyruvyl-6-hydroxy-3-cyclohexene-1-carboxylic-acid synthase [Kocuria coralli]